ncbi:MAG: YybH family protein [Acidobacteriota bacterium]
MSRKGPTTGSLFSALLVFCAAPWLAPQPRTMPQKNGAGTSRTAIAQLENRWVSALNHADLAALDAILADDFVRPAPTAGTFISKAQLLAYYRTHPSARSGITRRIEDMTIWIEDTTGIARGIVVTAGADHKDDSRQLFTDVFVLRSGRWQAVSAQENPIPR